MVKARVWGAMRIQSVASAIVAGTNRCTFGRATYHPNGTCGPRTQIRYQLVVVTQGSLRLKADGKIFELGPGDAILERPGQQEFFRFSPRQTSVHTWCEIEAAELPHRERRLLRGITGVCQVPSAIHVLIEEGLAMRNNESLEEARVALARACLVRFAQHAQAARQPANETPPHPAYVKAREAAGAHYAALRNAGDLALRAGVSAAQLRALFRRHGGESPSRMIWRLKVEHAIQLLRSTGLTLGEVAAQCGYANPFHLSRAVKKHTGYSPRDMRRHEWKR